MEIIEVSFDLTQIAEIAKSYGVNKKIVANEDAIFSWTRSARYKNNMHSTGRVSCSRIQHDDTVDWMSIASLLRSVAGPSEQSTQKVH